MKNKNVILLISLLTIFFNISNILAIECNYSPIASIDEKGNYTGPLPDYSLPEDLKWLVEQGNYIKLDSYNSGTAHRYSGGDETLKNWDNKNYCPNIIRVHDTTFWLEDCFFCDGTEWYGYDDLDSAKQEGDSYDKFFIYDEYLEELTKESPEYDHTVSYTCEYNGDRMFKINFNKDGYALSAESTLKDTLGVAFEYNLTEAMKTTKPEKVGQCENVHVCLSNSISSTYATVNYYTIFADELDYESHKSECDDDLFVGIIHGGTDDHENGCRTYGQYIEALDAHWINCKNSIESCNNYKNLKNKLLSLCNSITKYSHYEKSDCLKSCLNIKKDIEEIEQITYGASQCGFSEKLIHWVANIVRWVKYIIPVAVIVLGILDFMKAISADKEDEMKKAQKRFITRLIAAALIFIIPFIIEFVLEKMGFAANGCGIINL